MAISSAGIVSENQEMERTVGLRPCSEIDRSSSSRHHTACTKLRGLRFHSRGPKARRTLEAEGGKNSGGGGVRSLGKRKVLEGLPNQDEVDKVPRKKTVLQLGVWSNIERSVNVQNVGGSRCSYHRLTSGRGRAPFPARSLVPTALRQSAPAL